MIKSNDLSVINHAHILSGNGKRKKQMRLKSSGDRDRGGYPAVRYERGVVAESPTLCVGLGEGKGIAISLFYLYDAGGVKLRQEVYEGNKLNKKKYYVGGFIYENDKLELIQHSEGRIVPKNGKWDYQYHLKDHLGNVRLTFSTQPEQYVTRASYENETTSFRSVNRTTNLSANTTEGGEIK